MRRAAVLGVGALLAPVMALTLALPARAADGAWSEVPAPSPTASDARLVATACLTPQDCFAAGAYYDGKGYRTLIEEDRGAGWSIVPSPNDSATPVTNPGQDNYLTGMACVTGARCWAVGYWFDGTNHARTLTLTTTGSGWSIVPSADLPAVTDDIITAVTCATATDCWAVGSTLVPGFFALPPPIFLPGTPPQALTEHWDGSQWSLVNPAVGTASSSALYGVACAAASDCWAVGLDFSNGSYHSLAEENTGQGWTVVASADVPGSDEDLLDSAACVGGGCVAAGLYGKQGAANQTLAESGGAAGWQVTPTQDTDGMRLNSLSAVACAAAADCWAVGTADASGQFLFQPLIEHEAAGQWVIVPPHNSSTGTDQLLTAVTCPDAGDCVAVGYQGGPSQFQPFVEEYHPAPAATVPETPLLPLGLACGLLAAVALRFGGHLHLRSASGDRTVKRPSHVRTAGACEDGGAHGGKRGGGRRHRR